MSDTTEQRYKDARMDKLNKTVENLQGDITYIKTRIDHGFSTSMQSSYFIKWSSISG